jgi:hypothetical protein
MSGQSGAVFQRGVAMLIAHTNLPRHKNDGIPHAPLVFIILWNILSGQEAFGIAEKGEREAKII